MAGSTRQSVTAPLAGAASKVKAMGFADGAAAIGVVLCVYVVLALGWCATQMPICDEAFYGIPGRHLFLDGTTASPMLESAGRFLTRLERRTYWEMPFHLVLQAGWYRLAGVSIFSLRALSVLFGAAGSAAWYLILREWTKDPRIALFAVSLLAIDFHYLAITSIGRSDAASFGLGSAALATFLMLRGRRPKTAVFVSHCLVAMSGMTHPVGGLIAFAGTIYFQAPLLRKQGRRAVLAYAVIPYAVGGALWLAYILRDPAAFHDQFLGNSAGRLWPILHPLGALWGEISGHYLAAFGGMGRGAARVRLLVLVFYLCGVAACVIRGSERPVGVGTLLKLYGISSLVLFLFEGAKQAPYLLYVMPYLAGCAAVWTATLWKGGFRMAAAGAVSLVCVIQLACSGYVYRQNPYANKYSPAVRLLQAKAAPGSLTIGPAELALEVPNVVEDFNFGRISGKVPGFIVVPAGGDAELLAACQGNRVSFTRLKRLLAEDYTEIYDRVPFRIFERIRRPSG